MPTVTRGDSDPSPDQATNERSAQSGRPPILTRIAGTYGTQLAIALISFLNVVITARVLGAGGRGDVAFLTAIAMLTANVALFGIGEAHANLAASNPELRDRLVANSFVFAAIFGLLAVVVVAILIAIFPALGGSTAAWVRWVALAAVPVLTLQTYLQLLLQAGYAFGVTNRAWLIGPVVNLSASVLLAISGTLTVGTVVTAWVAGQALGTGLLVHHVVIRERTLGRPDAALARIALSFGVRTHVGRIMMVGNYRLDQWILGVVGTSRQLGLYSVAVALAETLFYLPTAIAMAQRPDLVRADSREAGRQATRGLRLGFVATGGLALALFLAAPFFIPPVFGEDFGGSVIDVRILLFGSFGIVAMKLLGVAVTAQRRPGLASVGAVVALAITVGLDLLLIPSHGDVGASIASTVAYTAGGAALALIAMRTLGCRVVDFIPRPAEAVELARQLRGRRA